MDLFLCVFCRPLAFILDGLLLFVEYVCCVSCASFVLLFVFESVGPFYYGWL